jgi:Protoheme ferro-lyase (ferrochelatase)
MQCPLALGNRCYCANQKSSFDSSSPENSPAAANSPAKTAVLLLAHGSPENPDQTPKFLKYVTGGRPLPPAVVEEIRHRYSLIGFSPLACWTLLQADQLSRKLGLPVFAGMRNWKPFIKDSVQAISDGGYERVIAVCLAPHNSRTSVGLYRSAVSADGNLPFAMDFVEEWHDEPLDKGLRGETESCMGKSQSGKWQQTSHYFHGA